MEVSFPAFELLLSVIKIPTCIISFFLAFKIKRLSDYVLNQLYYISFVSWGTFIGLDTALFLFAASSPILFLIANALRDVCVVMLTLIPLCFIIAGHVIKEGEEIAINTRRARILAAFAISFIIAVVVLLTDSVQVYDITHGAPWPVIDPSTLPPEVSYVVNFDTQTQWGAFGNAMIIVFVGWYVYGTFLMFVVQRKQSGVRKARARYIMAGVFMIPAGIVYFIILGYLAPADLWVQALLVMLGHGLWMVSPVLVYMGMKLRVPIEADTTSQPPAAAA